MTTASPVLTLKETCAYLKRGPTWVRARADKIGVIRDGGKLLFLQADLDAWLARHRVLETPAPIALPVARTSTPTALRGRINPLTRRPYGEAAR